MDHYVTPSLLRYPPDDLRRDRPLIFILNEKSQKPIKTPSLLPESFLYDVEDEYSRVVIHVFIDLLDLRIPEKR